MTRWERMFFGEDNNRKSSVMGRIQDSENVKAGRSLSLEERRELLMLHQKIVEIYGREDIFWR